MSNDTTTIEGAWSVSEGDQFDVMTIEIPGDEFEGFNRDWLIKSYDESRVEMETEWDEEVDQSELRWEKAE